MMKKIDEDYLVLHRFAKNVALNVRNCVTLLPNCSHSTPAQRILLPMYLFNVNLSITVTYFNLSQ